METSTHNSQTQRDVILQAALDTIAENKISGTSMRDIARRAGVSHGTLHYQFESKAQLLLAVLDELDFIFNDRRNREFARLDLSPSARLEWFLQQEELLLHGQRSIAEVFIDFWGHGLKDPAIRPKIQAMYENWRTVIYEVVKEGIDSGEFDPKIANLIPGLLVCIMEGASLQYLIDEDAFDLKSHFALSYEIILGGLMQKPPQRAAYPSDITAAEWAQIAPLLPDASSVGRPRSVDLREIVNAITYVSQAGCSWRMLPHDFPNWKTVYRYYNQWGASGILTQISIQLGFNLSQPDQVHNNE